MRYALPSSQNLTLRESASAQTEQDSPKKRLNLSVNAALLERAKQSGLNLSRTFEEGLAEKLRSLSLERWHAENREAIDAHNARIEREGLWHKGLTPWY